MLIIMMFNIIFYQARLQTMKIWKNEQMLPAHVPQTKFVFNLVHIRLGGDLDHAPPPIII